MTKKSDKPAGKAWLAAGVWSAIQETSAQDEQHDIALARVGRALFDVHPDMTEHDRFVAKNEIVDAGCDTDQAIQMIKGGKDLAEIIKKLKKNESSVGVGSAPAP